MAYIAANKTDCKRATFLIEKQQYTPLSMGEQIKLKLHLRGCSWCRTYQQQSENIQLMLARLFRDQLVRPKILSKNYKYQLKTLIIDKLKEK